jgi:molybdenum cofactor cytidylyltransferase
MLLQYPHSSIRNPQSQIRNSSTPPLQSAIRNPKSAIPLILLAAGGSTRMGTPKQLLPFGDTTLLRHAVETALASDCDPVLVVLGAAAESAAAAIAGLPVDAVTNVDWAKGMGTSLRLGLRTVLETTAPAAVVVMVCDQPAVTAVLIGELIDAYKAGATLVAAEYSGIIGVPALIGREWFEELLALGDDAGARALLKRHPDRVKPIPFPQGALDVDTPEDYQRLLGISRPLK